MSAEDKRIPMVPCCLCGAMTPAGSSLCLECLRTQVDICADIPKTYTIMRCHKCGRYQHNKQWIAAAPESPELLSMLVKKTRGLQNLKLIDASFIWTEPHSKRLKVKLTLQKDAQEYTRRSVDANGIDYAADVAEMAGTPVVQQQCIVEFCEENLFCDDCRKSETEEPWIAEVQLRQRAEHIRTLYYLEQVILKRGGHNTAMSLREATGGLDIFFATPGEAQKFIELIQSYCPVRITHAKRLLWHDFQNSFSHIRHIYMLEIPSICKDDLVVVPSGGKLGNGGIMICTRVSSSLYFVDPATNRQLKVSGQTYWSNTFHILASRKALREYIILDSELVPEPKTSPTSSKVDKKGSKFQLAEATIVRETDMGNDDATMIVRTHLGKILKCGDTALGYDIKNSCYGIEDYPSAKKFLDIVPDVILVKKKEEKKEKTTRKTKLSKTSGKTSSTSSEESDEVPELEKAPLPRKLHEDMAMISEEDLLIAEEDAQDEIESDAEPKEEIESAPVIDKDEE